MACSHNNDNERQCWAPYVLCTTRRMQHKCRTCTASSDSCVTPRSSNVDSSVQLSTSATRARAVTSFSRNPSVPPRRNSSSRGHRVLTASIAESSSRIHPVKSMLRMPSCETKFA